MKRAVAVAILGFLGVLGLLLLRMAPRQVDVSPRPVPVPSARALAFNDEGVRELRRGEAGKAVGSLRKARRLDPENSVVHQNLSLALAALADGTGDMSEKEILLVEAVGEWEGNVGALEALTALVYQQGRYREAWELVSRLLRQRPGDQAASQLKKKLEERLQETEGMVSEQGRRFVLVYSGAKALEFTGEILALMESQLDDLSVALGVFPRARLEVLMLTPDLGEKGRAPDRQIGAIYDGRIRLFLEEGKPDPEKLTSTLRHELIHALLFQVSRDMPAWLHEGVAQRVGERAPEHRVEEVGRRMKRIVEDGWWIPPLSLRETLISLPPEERSRAYALCLLFVDDLVRRHGDLFLPRLLSAMGEGVAVGEAYRQMTGGTLEEAQEGFTRRMRS